MCVRVCVYRIPCCLCLTSCSAAVRRRMMLIALRCHQLLWSHEGIVAPFGGCCCSACTAFVFVVCRIRKSGEANRAAPQPQTPAPATCHLCAAFVCAPVPPCSAFGCPRGYHDTEQSTPSPPPKIVRIILAPIPSTFCGCVWYFRTEFSSVKTDTSPFSSQSLPPPLRFAYR